MSCITATDGVFVPNFNSFMSQIRMCSNQIKSVEERWIYLSANIHNSAIELF